MRKINKPKKYKLIKIKMEKNKQQKKREYMGIN